METLTAGTPPLPQMFRSHRSGTQTLSTIGLGKTDRLSLTWEVRGKGRGK